MNATGRMRRTFEDELRYLARQDEEGESARRKEMRSSEESWLVSARLKAEDPFRAVAWSLNAICGWHPAAITMGRFRSGQVDPLPTRVSSCLCGIAYFS